MGVEVMGIVTWFQESVLSNTLMMVFLIAVIGYLVGSIKICGLELGTAGILLVALVFGHFGVEIPSLVRELGLICFVYNQQKLPYTSSILGIPGM